MRRYLSASLICAGILCPGALQAGTVIHGITKPVFSTNQPLVYKSDLSLGDNTLLFDVQDYPQVQSTAPGFSGMAANDAAGIIYAGTVNGTTTGIYTIDYATLTPTFLTTTKRPDGTNGPVIDGLAYDTRRELLYGTRVLGGSTGAEGRSEHR